MGHPTARVGGNGDASVNGDPTAYSDTSATASITVTPVNDQPIFTGGADQTVREDAGLRTVNNWATNIQAYPAAPARVASITGSIMAGLVAKLAEPG